MNNNTPEHDVRRGPVAWARAALPLFLLLLMAGAAAAAGGRHSQAGNTAYLPVSLARPTFAIDPVGRGFFEVTEVTHAGDARLFVSQLPGVILVMHPNGEIKTFLDINERVLRADGELGLFDIAFHPGYMDPASPGYGFFYVSYTTGVISPEEFDVSLIISRFRVTADPDVAGPDSEAILLEVNQESNVHKGGALEFDPRDNRLYIGIGDDKSPLKAQETNTPKGKIITLDVDQVPADTAGYASGLAPAEVVATGLRNPWRIALDVAMNRLFIADVGAGRWEEINLMALDGANNFGWPCREGSFINPDLVDFAVCHREFTEPVHQYPHDAGDGRCAIIGGRVLRTPVYPNARYIFGDLCSREVLALSPAGAGWNATLLGKQTEPHIFATIGEGADGSLYLGSFAADAPIYRLIVE